MLIDLAKDCGANAVKFQCFTVEKIVSKEGFDELRMGFQAKWGKSVYEVYNNAEFPREWHDELFHYATKKGLHFLEEILPPDFSQSREKRSRRPRRSAYVCSSGNTREFSSIERDALGLARPG